MTERQAREDALDILVESSFQYGVCFECHQTEDEGHHRTCPYSKAMRDVQIINAHAEAENDG